MNLAREVYATAPAKDMDIVVVNAYLGGRFPLTYYSFFSIFNSSQSKSKQVLIIKFYQSHKEEANRQACLKSD